jgi:hypothetical protein
LDCLFRVINQPFRRDRIFQLVGDVIAGGCKVLFKKRQIPNRLLKK